MTVSEAIARLKELIRDRECFMTGDANDDEVWMQDIEALNFAIEVIKSASAYLCERLEKKNSDRSG